MLQSNGRASNADRGYQKGFLKLVMPFEASWMNWSSKHECWIEDSKVMRTEVRERARRQGDPARGRPYLKLRCEGPAEV